MSRALVQPGQLARNGTRLQAGQALRERLDAAAQRRSEIKQLLLELLHEQGPQTLRQLHERVRLARDAAPARKTLSSTLRYMAHSGLVRRQLRDLQTNGRVLGCVYFDKDFEPDQSPPATPAPARLIGSTEPLNYKPMPVLRPGAQDFLCLPSHGLRC